MIFQLWRLEVQHRSHCRTALLSGGSREEYAFSLVLPLEATHVPWLWLLTLSSGRAVPLTLHLPPSTHEDPCHYTGLSQGHPPISRSAD